MELTPAEGRVLGCLVEKQLTTPQLYPLTENALIAACNQTTSRDPVVSYDVDTVRRSVRSLREQQLLRTVHRTGERSDKHQHQLDTALELSPTQVTLLAVLLLRGPQTVAELRTRAERMHRFDSAADLGRDPDAMAQRSEPLVTRLQRQPGRKESRYAQLVTGSEPGRPVVAPPAAPEVPVATPPTPPPAPTAPAAPPAPSASAVTVESLAAEFQRLRREVEQLRDELRRRPPGG